MAEIPPNTPYDPMKALGEWFLLRKQLSDIKNAEMAARKQLFTHFFPSPKEGTNTYDLPDGYKLKGTYALERKVDEAVWQVNREKFAEAKIPETVIRWTPELAKSNYNELTAEQQTFFDQCLIIKPGAPTLEITKPKPKGKAGEVHEG
jgi:hypothetical protein